MKCQNCGAEIDDNAAFCGECGSKVTQNAFGMAALHDRSCRFCGAKLQDGAMFCSVCGQKVKIEEDRAQEFRKAAKVQLDRQLPGIIEENLPELAGALSKVIAPEVKKPIERRLREWRDGKWRQKKNETLVDVLGCVRADCSRISFNHLYDKTIKTWVNGILVEKAVQIMEPVCREHGVRKLEAEDCRVVNLPDLKIEPEIEWVFSCLDVDRVVVRQSIWGIAWIIIMLISGAIGFLIDLLSGEFMLTVIFFAVGFYLGWIPACYFLNWWNKNKVSYSEKMAHLKKNKLLKYNRSGRKGLVKDTLDEDLVNNRLQAEIRSTILRGQNREKITEAVSACLKEQIEKYIQELK